MKLNVAIFTLFLGLFSGICAMEEQPSQNITLKLSDGQTISFPAEVALHSSLIRGHLDNTAMHSISDNSPIIDFSEQQLFMRDIDDSDEHEKIHDLALNSNIMRAVFDCVIHGKKALHTLNKDELNSVFEVGNYLGIPQRTMRKLTRYIQKNVVKDEQPKLVQVSHYCNSIRSLYRDNALQIVLRRINELGSLKEIECEPYQLIVKPQKIDVLYGIEDLAKKYEKMFIRDIYLDSNSLKVLDVVQLMKLFPFLTKISADGKAIEKLILPATLPAEFVLLLHKNKIKELPIFKLGEGCYIDLRNNPLSDSAKENAQRVMCPSLMEVNRPLVNTLSSSDSFKNGAKYFGYILPYITGCGYLGALGSTAFIKYFRGARLSIISTPKEVLKLPSSLAIMGVMTLGLTGFVWYTNYFKSRYSQESSQNSYKMPLIDYDVPEEK